MRAQHPSPQSATAAPRRRFRPRRLALVVFVFGQLFLWGAYAFGSGALHPPVDGVPLARIPPTFGAPRDGGRSRHQGVDILAARGTPVRSVAWGVVLALEKQPRGGKVVFVAGDGALLFFYAHLNDHAPGLHVGQIVSKGTLLGYVGDSGNAKGVPHLHFEARPAATLFAPIDPRILMRPRRVGPAERILAALATIAEPR
ncbi:murein hydrolase activator EnvC family protein [Polyangium jinanense]|uniref:M23 family metallopeptidase n=1 Tax=Polyangium jinanense TaxID=2829994 RepID=A0A9X4AVW7_9BACT|nr:M23 family metallopeptidase [Polyangium jinanense]MDC3959537.1 M23 family metallopeptidase [Polyangium jinanense]MDC3986136.1 M23 family metallopeptidase [Polyangium jinanense]